MRWPGQILHVLGLFQDIIDWVSREPWCRFTVRGESDTVLKRGFFEYLVRGYSTWRSEDEVNTGKEPRCQRQDGRHTEKDKMQMRLYTKHLTG